MHGSKEEVPMAVDSGGVVIRLTEWGEMNVALETFPAGTDTAPIFKGLPDDRCQTPTGATCSGDVFESAIPTERRS